MTGGFHFTVTDLARFLGKSSVTLRSWERKGLLSFPRDASGDRKFSTTDIRDAARKARALKRISNQRLQYIESCVTMLELIERENSR
jgi:predicted site-specific integrase-resolvase